MSICSKSFSFSKEGRRRGKKGKCRRKCYLLNNEKGSERLQQNMARSQKITESCTVSFQDSRNRDGRKFSE